MKRRLTMLAPTLIVLVTLVSVVLTVSSSAYAQGAMQIAGVGFFAEPGECTDVAGNSADFALKMTGDLDGCLYVFVLESECSPSGFYRETGSEIFVATGQTGIFDTTYRFTAKLGSCPDLTTEIWGRCQHPIVRGTGLGVFEGATGRFDIKDDVAAGNFPYKGHLRWWGQ